MLTAKLANTFDTLFYQMEISPELQNFWAAEENRYWLITHLRNMKNTPMHTPPIQKKEGRGYTSAEANEHPASYGRH